MAVLHQKSVLEMIKEFRRNWHTLCNSERTTVCGADSMLLTLQLSMAENNKQHNGEFTVFLSDVLLTWKYFLHEKLNLPLENMEVIDHYEEIRKTYDDFLKNSNMVDLIDVYQKYGVLTSSCEKDDNISPSQLRDFLSGRQYAVNDETDFCVPTSPTSKHNEDNGKRTWKKSLHRLETCCSRETDVYLFGGHIIHSHNRAWRKRICTITI
ncbi:PCNA-interacting partner isoform X1 [Choloepus didactylus]|uniref:PCNA-interacting partner isoform X1 n=1 Tax=Choloepus didactylus TaxID=27675 RepID=UPI00189F53F1|nr:PCNA-interacting partner isoform X1 [Choloepus didactylus]